MTTKPGIDAVLIQAIAQQSNPSLKIDKDQAKQIAGAILVALDQAGYMIVPHQLAPGG